MFRRAKLPWDKLLTASIGIILKKFKIIEGILVIDDKDLSRSKNAKNLYRLHKIKDKKTGGYILGQNIVSLYLVTKRVNIPVGFEFYAPDPDLKKWYQEIRRCKKNKIDKKSWPDKPERSPEYLKKYELAVKLVADFKKSFKEVKIQTVTAGGDRFFIPSRQKNRFVIPIKYKGYNGSIFYKMVNRGFL